MRRYCLAALLPLASLALTACSSLNPFASEPRLKPADLVAFKPTADVVVQWQASVGRGEEYVFSPAVVGESVYVAGADGSLARLDAGRQVWRVQAGQPLSAGVGSNGRLVAVGTPKGEVLTFDAATGKPLWQVKVSSEILAAPTVADDMVVARSGDSRIYGLAATDGKRRWVYQRDTPTLAVRNSAGVVLGGRAILAGFPGGKLLALNPANGGALWEATVAVPKGTTELERVADVTSLPVVYGSTVCAVAYQGRVACFELSNGKLLWSRDVSSTAGIDVDQKAVYVSDDKGNVLAYDRSNGASLWKQDKLSWRNLFKPLVAGSYLVVPDGLGVIHLLNLGNGSFAARYPGGKVMSDPKSFKEGFVVQMQDGTAYALSIR